MAGMDLLLQQFSLGEPGYFSTSPLPSLPRFFCRFAHGSLFGISGILILERFGMRTFSSNNGILALAPALFGALA
jgi:hypothetical protein